MRHAPSAPIARSQDSVLPACLVCSGVRFRVKAIEYDPHALSAAVAAEESGGKEKKDEDETPKPISAKDRDRIARRIFVQRVTNIYTSCMSKELSTGTSISHTSRFGLDPARLLRDNDTDE